MQSLHRKAETRQLGDRSGLALVATLIVLAVMGVVITGAVRSALTALRTSGLDYQEARAFYAAEAGGETALSQLKLALQDGVLKDDELASIQPPIMDGFSFDSFSVAKVGAALVEDITDGPYTGLYSLTQKVDIYSLAEDANGTVAGVVLRAKAQAIPIFQFGVFYEEDLEATNGPPLEFLGRVHSNGNIYLSSRNAWYREPITTPNKVFHDRKDNHTVYNGVFINDAMGVEAPLDFDSRSIPGPEAFKTRSCQQFSCRLMTDAFDVDSLELPLPPGVPAYELILPREGDDGDAEKSVKFAWNADMYVTVDFTNMKDWNASCSWWKDVGGNVEIPTITAVRSGGRPVPNETQLCRMFQWQWAAFYDGREDELKDIVQIRIDEIAAWVAGDPSRQMEIIYVEIEAPANLSGFNVPTRNQILDGVVDPAVRVDNGAQLPNRMTIATAWPMYVRGDYNSVLKQPAAVAGDGITILSRFWVDTQNRPGTEFADCENTTPCIDYMNWANAWDYFNAGETTVNAAILAGHWPTPCDHEVAGCTPGYGDFYGGGIENFPRFIERWRGATNADFITFHYKGALVSPFTSKKTTGTWNGSYYRPPQRDWSFDTDFRDPEKLPPGTPNVGNVVRTAMREAF
jgi:hypothetical protein